MALEEEKKDKEKKEEKKEDNDDEEGGSGIMFIAIIIIAVVLGVAYFLPDGFSGITGRTISGDSVRIGVMAPLSGDAASYGVSVKRGIDMAQSELGLSNYELIYEDTKCEGKEAVTAINKLISVDRVVAIIGELCSGATLAAAPIAEENGVVMISSASTSPEITNAGDYIFRTVPSDELQGSFGANLVSELGYEQLAVLYSNEDYGLGFSQVLEDEFSGEIVASEPFERGATDLRAQITKIKNSGADSIFIISNSPDSAVAALKQIKQLDLSARVFGSEGLKSDDIAKGAGNAIEGLIVTSVSSGTEEFFQRHKNFHGKSPGPFAPQGYDALQALSLVIEAGAKNNEAIKDGLYGLVFDGVSGRLDFDENGDVEGNYEIFKVRGGNFIPVLDNSEL